MKISRRKAVSTTLAAVVIIIIVVAAAAAIYISTTSVKTVTSTQTSTATTTAVSTSTATTTAVSTSTATSTATATTTAVSTATATTTAVSTTTATTTAVSTSTATTTATTTTTTTATPTTSIPSQTLIIGDVGTQWAFQPIGTDPQMSAGSANPWFPNVYEALFAYDPAQLANGNYVPIPWLAQSFTLSPNGLTATITLRQGIKFHTGNTMTSADVKYSLDRYLFFNDYPTSVTTAVGGGTQYRNYYASITNVTATDPSTVVITLAHPDPLLPDELASEMLYVMDSAVTESHAVTTSNSSDHGFDWLNNHGGDVGTGPFSITSETLESRIQLSKFANYWGGTLSVNTPVKSIIYIAYADATAARFALEKGTVNMLIDATDQETAALAQEPGFSTIHAPGGLWMNLQMHPVGPLADWRVREAIKMAIDYKGIISSLSYGLDYYSQSMFAIGMQGWTNASAGYFSRQAPNITGAKALLAQAGYPNGFTINLYTRPSSRFGITFTDFSVILQSDLAAIGINLVIQTYVVGQFYNYEYELSLPGMWTQPSSLLLWGPNFASVLPGTSGNALSIGWNSSTEKGPGVNFTLMTSLYQKALQETNTATRIAEEQQIDTYFIKYGPYLPVIEMSDKIVYVNTITGLLWNAVGDNFVLTPTLSSP